MKTSLAVSIIGASCYLPMLSSCNKHPDPAQNQTAKDPDTSVDQIAPFAPYDFGSQDWTMTVEIDSSDFQSIDKRVPAVPRLSTSDAKLLEHIKRTWLFKESGGDMATVTSGISLFKNGTKVFSAGIVLSTGSAGLQSRELGWAPVVDEANFFASISKFQVK